MAASSGYPISGRGTNHHEDYSHAVRELLNALTLGDLERASELETRIDQIVERWENDS